MKRLFLMLMATALIASVAVAQENKNADMKASHAEWEKKLKDELKLTPEQNAKYDALSKEYSAKIEATLQDASLNKDAQKEKKMALKKEKETKLFEILTPEQQTTYKNLIEKKKKEMEPKSKPAGA